MRAITHFQSVMLSCEVLLQASVLKELVDRYDGVWGALYRKRFVRLLNERVAILEENYQ